jgi:hypothetical protein
MRSVFDLLSHREKTGMKAASHPVLKDVVLLGAWPWCCAPIR